MLAVRYSEVFAVFGTLYLLAYVFLLRLPSEALPAVFCEGAVGSEAQSVLTLEGCELVLRLKRRKNRPGGSTLRRKCWCRSSPTTCPIHVLLPAFQGSQGVALFAGITACAALSVLRRLLGELGVAGHEQYGTHGFRRGHAEDLRASGCLCFHQC